VAAFEIRVGDLDKDNPVGRDKIRPKDSIGSKWHRNAAPRGRLVLQEPASPSAEGRVFQ
jgi:hypothetical protein